jgi:hypothetical protein
MVARTGEAKLFQSGSASSRAREADGEVMTHLRPFELNARSHLYINMYDTLPRTAKVVEVIFKRVSQSFAARVLVLESTLPYSDRVMTIWVGCRKPVQVNRENLSRKRFAITRCPSKRRLKLHKKPPFLPQGPTRWYVVYYVVASFAVVVVVVVVLVLVVALWVSPITPAAMWQLTLKKNAGAR